MPQETEGKCRFAAAAPWIYVEKVEASFQEHSASGARIAQSLGRRPWGTLDYCLEDPDGYRLVSTEAPEEPSQPTSKPKASDDR